MGQIVAANCAARRFCPGPWRPVTGLFFKNCYAPHIAQLLAATVGAELG